MSIPGSKSIVRRRAECGIASEWRADDQDAQIPPLLKRIFEYRGVDCASQTRYPLQSLLAPDSLSQGKDAADIVAAAIRAQKRILILGDYDADGATATALGILCLGQMGSREVSYLVPNRFEYGYGLSPEIAAVALQRKPDLVITVDNGINSIEGVEILRQGGVEVIVTDHHLPGEDLPRANAIVNPNQHGCQFPSKCLSGVGVMFYLLLLVRKTMQQSGWFERLQIPIPRMADYLDLVALGTVADVVPLDYNNRILVAQGLARIRAGRARPGILALLETGGKQFNSIGTSDLGFFVAPRLNAAGRMDDISMGIECLVCNHGTDAGQLAGKLNSINIERQAMEKKMQGEAQAIVSREIAGQAATQSSAGSQHQGYCLYDASWHQGITGLVASRIKDKVSQPVVAFARTAQDTLTGSARSVTGMHIRDLFERITLDDPALINRFGGHAMAAGLTISPQNFDAFRQAFHNQVAAHYATHTMEKAVYTDGGLEISDFNLHTAKLLKNAAPWGQGFPAPLFDGSFEVVEQKIVGDVHVKFVLRLPQSDRCVDAIAFRVLDPGVELGSFERIHAVFQLEENTFRGRATLQLIIEYFNPLE